MRREFGGCAGNIAYNLKLLGGEPVIMATVGDDARRMSRAWTRSGSAASSCARCPARSPRRRSSPPISNDNQITAFHPGAMNHSHLNTIDAGAKAGSRSSRRTAAMAWSQHVDQLAAAKVPFIFDPGQGMPMFSGPELLGMIERAAFVAVNDYEGKMLEEKTGRTLAEIARRVKALVVTKGAEGSTIYAEGQRHEIPSVKPQAVVDPTGCGDAYRSGLLYGIASGYDWPTTGRLASLMGSIKVASRGGQNHSITRADIGARYAEAFGRKIW